MVYSVKEIKDKLDMCYMSADNIDFFSEQEAKCWMASHVNSLIGVYEMFNPSNKDMFIVAVERWIDLFGEKDFELNFDLLDEGQHIITAIDMAYEKHSVNGVLVKLKDGADVCEIIDMLLDSVRLTYTLF